MSKPVSTLLLFAHPSIDRSEVNRPLLQRSREVPGVTIVDLYAEYPRFNIDIDTEQQRLRDHELVIFMFPLYWYSTPALLKEWQDLVLEYGVAYGVDGDALRGKSLLCVLSAGGAEDAYRSQGLNHYDIRELLRPLEQTATLCGMKFLPPYTLFGSRTAVEEGRLSAHLDGWENMLRALSAGDLGGEDLAGLTKLNQHPLAGGER